MRRHLDPYVRMNGELHTTMSDGAKVVFTEGAWEAVGDLLREACDHNEMTERKDDPDHAWQCAKCGHVYGQNPNLSRPTH